MKDSKNNSYEKPTSEGSVFSCVAQTPASAARLPSWAAGGLRRIGNVLTSLGDMFLPRTCLVCETRLSADEKFMCRACSEDIPLTYYWDIPYNPAADRLNECIQRKFEASFPEPADLEPETAPTPSTDEPQLMATLGTSTEEPQPKADGADAEDGSAERDQYEPYSQYAGLFFYNDDNGYRHICHRLKYGGDIALGRHYSRLLGEKLAGSELFRDVDLVVPVPLHWTRQWKRGYNQADIIAQEVAAVLGAEHKARLLVRNRRTQTQTVLSVEEKKRNVEGAFSVNRRAVPSNKPHHILLVDDMMTTGSTLAACHAALREVFPTSVKISAASLGCYETK